MSPRRLTGGPATAWLRIAMTALSALSALTALTGCTSMSGIDAGSSYACKAPEGVVCESVSGTYANAVQHNLPSQRRRAPEDAARRPEPPASAPSRVLPPSGAGSGNGDRNGAATPLAAPTPVSLRSAPRILRLWFKPWEDADHDLYDQGYVYVQVEGGRWQIEHVQRQIREAYAPIRAAIRDAGTATEANPPAAPTDAPRTKPEPLSWQRPAPVRPVTPVEPRGTP